jgi:flagellar hook-associated protein 1 FlgK
MLEPGGSSIGNALDQLFNAFSALGSNPSDNALRQQVQQAGITLTGRVRDMYSRLNTQANELNGEITGTIQQAQSLINNIASMNAQIKSHQLPGATANDLLDARDQAVQDLSAIIPVQVQPQQDGSILLFSGQLTLVDSSGPATLPTSFDPNLGVLTGGGTNFPVGSAKLAGLFQTVQKIGSYKQQLDTFANTLRTQFNSIHSTGTNGLGATGQNFFNDVAPPNPQTGAIDFNLDPAVLGDPRAIATGVSGDPGDGGLALSISQLRSTNVAALGGRTFSQFYGDFVSGVGLDVSFSNSQVETSQAILRQIDEQVQSVSGVSLDDEMANMLRFQRSYQAAAKALSVFDQTTEELINMLH